MEKLRAASAAAARTLSWRQGKDSGILEKHIIAHCKIYSFLFKNYTMIFMLEFMYPL
jgi:hypothetical protein